jgi:phosphoribosylformylglycinamidine synthase
MKSPRVLILRAPGTNCDLETQYAFDRAGGAAERVHVNRVLDDPAAVDRFQILCIPGGFSYGDDLAAGKILAGKIRHRLAEAFRRFSEQQKLILGICNGFQVLLKSGVLLNEQQERPLATLDWNDSGRFEARWVTLDVDGRPNVFLTGLERLELPVAHAEGKFVTRDGNVLEDLKQQGQIVLRYGVRQLTDSSGQAAYPDNPNGSMAGIAGISDPTGRILGLMPHPERYVDAVQHPQWTRLDRRGQGQGLRLFENAVNYFR